MKKNILFMTAAAFMLSTLVGCSCLCGSGKETADSLIAKMQKAIDPSGKLDKITSAEVVYKITSSKEQGTVTLKVQAPGKLRLEVQSGDRFMVKGYNGKMGWEYSNKKGLRKLSGDELSELKFQAAYLAPNVKFNKLFSSIKLDGEEKAAGSECWKLICQPQSKYHSQPVIMLVDKENYLVVKTIEKYDFKKEIIDISTYFGNYKAFDGIMVPKLMVSEVGGNLMENKLKQVKWNVEFSPGLFDMPKPLSK